jgi:hypothetical protein
MEQSAGLQRQQFGRAHTPAESIPDTGDRILSRAGENDHEIHDFPYGSRFAPGVLDHQRLLASDSANALSCRPAGVVYSGRTDNHRPIHYDSGQRSTDISLNSPDEHGRSSNRYSNRNLRTLGNPGTPNADFHPAQPHTGPPDAYAHPAESHAYAHTLQLGQVRRGSLGEGWDSFHP